MNYKSEKLQAHSKTHYTSRSFQLSSSTLSLSVFVLSPTKADLSVELKSFCGVWQFFLRLLPYHSHMLYNLSSPWPKHKALSASQKKEKLPLKKEKKILHFNAYVWESGSSEHRKIENSHTLPHIQCNVNGLGSSLHKHIMYTARRLRDLRGGATVRSTKT